LNGESTNSVTDEWQIMQALQERKMKIREDLEKQIDKAKIKLQKQWVIEQIREKKQKLLYQAH
jgi:hypothetical protein